MKAPVCCVCLLAAVFLARGAGSDRHAADSEKAAALPPPATVGGMPLVEAIAQRRSKRAFLDQPLTIEDVSQLCWAAQGTTDSQRGFRTSPSAGALFPVELYVVTADGVDHYRPSDHRLDRHLPGDLRGPLQAAALDQDSVGHAAACMVITAVVDRTARKYGSRAERYCFIEAGHVAQNILLQATALKLAGVPVGAFQDQQVASVLKLPQDRRVLYLVPIGYPAD
ncbi:MAG TPA: SagB/ThcOx family dehydrogenase [Phycisphaerae bacterium]|nr:SagB/ThcOx family dehydrogenase [Phycisphaerae bacterium]